MKLLSHFFPLKRQSQCCQVDASQNYGVIVEVKAIKVVEGQGRRHMSSIHGLRGSHVVSFGYRSLLSENLQNSRPKLHVLSICSLL